LITLGYGFPGSSNNGDVSCSRTVTHLVRLIEGLGVVLSTLGNNVQLELGGC
jgi:hypothetical protein